MQIIDIQTFINVLFFINQKMAHQCIHCGKIIGIGSKEILDGCEKCGGRFFFYIKDEVLKKMEQEREELPTELLNPEMDKQQVEEDVREILKIDSEEKPVILDFESVRVLDEGKFEIDLVSLFNKKPIVFKLEEGKYIIDLESALPKK